MPQSHSNESKLTSADYRSAAQKVRSALLETELGPHIESLAVLGITHMEAEADRLDAEQVAETESFSFLNELARAFRSGESNPRPSHFPVLEGIRAVLAHLTSAGRLLAADEMRLTAELAEDLRMVLDSFGFNQVTPEVIQAIEAAERLNRALFPAAEPAEERCRKWTVRVAGGIETGIQCVLPDGHECFHDYVPPIHNYVQPAPAEPAEEETKADGSAGTVCDETQKAYDEAVSLSYWLAKQLGEHVDDAYDRGETLTDTVQRLIEHIRPNRGKTKTTSSPVVPAPTETGPWPTWQRVPEGVKYKSGAKDWVKAEYVNRSGIRMAVVNGEEYPSTTDESKIQGLAPFVAAEEG